MGLSDHRPRWPRPRRVFGPVCAHATSNVVPAMLSVASTHTEPKSSIAPARGIIAATGEKSGLAGDHKGRPYGTGAPSASPTRDLSYTHPALLTCTARWLAV